MLHAPKQSSGSDDLFLRVYVSMCTCVRVYMRMCVMLFLVYISLILPRYCFFFILIWNMHVYDGMKLQTWPSVKREFSAAQQKTAKFISRVQNLKQKKKKTLWEKYNWTVEEKYEIKSKDVLNTLRIVKIK